MGRGEAITYINADSQANFIAKPMGYRTMKNLKNFLLHYAKSNNLNPLDPETYYNIPYTEILPFKVFIHLLRGRGRGGRE